jgi:hypothetical protein
MRNGFVFDQSGQFLHMRDRRIQLLVAKKLKDNFVLVDRNAWIYIHLASVPYPFQAHLSYPTECLKNTFLDGVTHRSFDVFRQWHCFTRLRQPLARVTRAIL